MNNEPARASAKTAPRIVITVRVSKAGDDAIRKIAAAKGITVSEARRAALAEYVANHKDLL